MLLEKLTYGDKPVRINLDDQGEPWFCLSDVADVLGIVNHKHFPKSEHCQQDGVRTLSLTDALGRGQDSLFINEPNLYALIFRSNKQESKSFREWVFGEVLPQIRKTGSYDAGIDITDPIMVMAKTALDLRRRQIQQEQELKDHEQRISHIEQSRARAKQGLMELPEAKVELDELPMTKNCRLAVDDIAHLTGNGHHEIWQEAYRQYELRQDCRLTTRLRNFNAGRRPKDQISKLAYVEKFGDINVLYSVLMKMSRLAKALPI